MPFAKLGLPTALLRGVRAAGYQTPTPVQQKAIPLVMEGVDLFTVKELLGHSDFDMTQRYAHLSPEHQASAVEKLVSSKIKRRR